MTIQIKEPHWIRFVGDMVRGQRIQTCGDPRTLLAQEISICIDTLNVGACKRVDQPGKLLENSRRCILAYPWTIGDI
jgi:hypothetical protein